MCMHECLHGCKYVCMYMLHSQFFFNGLEKLRTGMVAVNDKLDPESFYENLKVTRINPYSG